MRMHIDSNNTIVEENLRKIAEIVIQYGGYIHPNCTFHQRQENLWISCNGAEASTRLLIIPDALFVPASNLDWFEVEGKIVYRGELDSLSNVRRSLLDAMVTIYNHVEKLPKFIENHPIYQMPFDLPMMDWLRTNTPTIILPTDSSARQFINTRLFGDPLPESPDGDVGYLMPLLDYLNHHPYGPKFERFGTDAWQVATPNYILDNAECFVRYFKSDAFSIALWHGYFEPNTRHVASLDCILNAGKAGYLHIVGTHPDRKKFNAPRVLPALEGIKLLDIVLEQSQLSGLRTILGLALRSQCSGLTQADAETHASELLQQLITANLKAYSELAEICLQASIGQPLKHLFGQVAAHQINLLLKLSVP